MRTIVLSFVIVVSVSAAVAAEAEQRRTQWSLVTSDATRGFGLAFARDLTPRWSAELKVAQDRHSAGVSSFLVLPESTGGLAVVVSERVPVYTYPLDLVAHYRFTRSAVWTPYVTGGVRYVRGPHVHPLVIVEPAVPYYGYARFKDRYDAQFGVGMMVRISRNFGLRVDADALLRNDGVFYDRRVRPSIGLTWRF